MGKPLDNYWSYNMQGSPNTSAASVAPGIGITAEENHLITRPSSQL